MTVRPREMAAAGLERLDLLALGENAVETPTCLDEDGRRARDLQRGARDEYLTRGEQHVSSGAHQFSRCATGVNVRTLPGLTQLITLIGDERTAGLGEFIGASRSIRTHRDQSFVLQLLEYRVDRARARTPRFIRALGEFLDELIAVAGLLFEEHEHRRSNVTSLSATLSAATGSTTEATARTRVTVPVTWATSSTKALRAIRSINSFITTVFVEHSFLHQLGRNSYAYYHDIS